MLVRSVVGLVLAVAVFAPGCGLVLDPPFPLPAASRVDASDRPDATDATDVIGIRDVALDAPDVHDATDIPDVRDASIDAIDATDVPDLRDVRDVPDLRDARDAREVSDVRDAPDVHDVPIVRDVTDVPVVIVCPSPAVLCSGVCVDTQSNNSSCGACRAMCPAGTTCRRGQCERPCSVPNTSGPCAMGTQRCPPLTTGGCLSLRDFTACVGPPAAMEVCGNNTDDDCNGLVDDNCDATVTCRTSMRDVTLTFCRMGSICPSGSSCIMLGTRGVCSPPMCISDRECPMGVPCSAGMLVAVLMCGGERLELVGRFCL